MAFPPELLNRDEEIVVDIRPHWWFITPASITLGAAVFIGLLIWLNTGDGTLEQVLQLFWGVVVLVALAWFAARYAKWVTTNFVVTTDRVIYRVGVFAKHGIEIPVEKINAVHFDQRIFERILGLGTLRIESASETGASEFEDIRKPSAVQNLIHQQMEAQGDRDVQRIIDATRSGGQSPPPPPPPSPTLSIPEQIEKLDELRERGAITEEEFQAKKAELLKRM